MGEYLKYQVTLRRSANEKLFHHVNRPFIGPCLSARDKLSQFLFVEVFTFAARSSLDVCVNAPTFVSLVIAHMRSPLAQVLLPARTDRLLTSPRHLNYLTPSYWLRGTRADRSSFSQSLARTYSRCRNGK